MRLVLAVSALLAATLMAGTALAQDCDDCRSRDRPNPAKQMRERMQAAPRERIPDRRPATERPAVIKDRPADVAKVKGMNPKSAHNDLEGRTTSSDRKIRSITKAPPPAGRDMVVAHANKNGGSHGGRAYDADLMTSGVAKQAKTAGLKLKVLQIVKPAKSRPIISPAGAPSGCSNGGNCIDGSAKGATPSIDQSNERYTPKLVTKVQGEKENLQKNNPSTVQPNYGLVMTPQAAPKATRIAPAAASRPASEPLTKPEAAQRPDVGKD